MDAMRAGRIKKIRAGLDSNGAEWVELSVELIAEYSAGRSEHASDKAFGYWLVDNELDQCEGPNERAALLNMGRHLEKSQRALRETKSRSYRLIWEREIEPTLTFNVKPTPEQAETEMPAETMPISANPSPSLPDSGNVLAPTPQESRVAGPSAAKTVNLDYARRNSPLRDEPKFALWNEYVTDTNTRNTWTRLHKKHLAKPIWRLLIQSIESGLYGPREQRHAVDHPTLRLLLPWAPHSYSAKYDLTTTTDRALVTNVIFPVVSQHLALVHQDPTQLERLVNASVGQQQQAAQQRAQAKKLAAAAARMPSTETTVIAYGVTLWPIVDGLTPQWTHAELCHAMWYCDFLVPQLRSDMTPQGRALQMNQILKWILPAFDSGWAKAVRHIAYCYEKAPDVPCQVPPPPVHYRIG